MPSKRVLIIGAGIAGIAAAIRLALKGYAVEVFEANSYPGGKLSEVVQDSYRFDAGPSLLTMPQYIDELFTLAGKNPSHYFTYQKLDTVCKYFYADGAVLNAFANTEKFIVEAASVTAETESAIARHIQNSQKIYDITDKVFLQGSLHRLKNYLTYDALNALVSLPQIDTLRTMHRANQSFFKGERMVQFFDRYATYNGSNPYAAPATLNIIPHLEQHYGAYFPTGGIHAITDSLVKLAESLGAKFRYNSPVEKIIINRDKAEGVKVNGELIAGDIIISNMDVYFTYKRLLSAYTYLHPEKVLRQERSSSALVFYWGINKQFRQLDLHNIFFSADYRAEFDAIWKSKSIYHDPTVYLNITSKYKPDDAPAGCENWFTMINVPANDGQDWDMFIAKSRQNIIKKLSEALGEDVERLIVSECLLDPRAIENKTSSYQGSIYGTSSNSRFSAFLRHPNRSSKIKNLYFCGGSVHPGGGIPLCLLSAKIVSEWIGG